MAVFGATIVAIIALAVLPLLTPWFVHAALDAAGSADRLGLDASTTAGLSDRSVESLVLGSGDFAVVGPDGEPFYDPDERGHLRDARLLLWAVLVAGALSALLLLVLLRSADVPRRRALWSSVSLAGATTAISVVLIGAISLVAFDQVFTVFHQVFFPAGNWSFDPSRQRLVQLYPFAFWQVASAALGLLVLTLGTATWWTGRRMAQPRGGSEGGRQEGEASRAARG